MKGIFIKRSAALLVASLALNACSSASHREYQTPDSLCGVKVPKDLMEAVLPSGKKVSQTPKDGTGSRSCYLDVDEEGALVATVEWVKDGTSLEDFSRIAYGIDSGDKTTADRRYLYSPTGAAGFVKCPAPGRKYVERDVNGDLLAWIRTGGEPVKESDMKSLIVAYTEALADSTACKGDIW
ncbi:hypothetical protein [Streptomyces sudanensis]|uniref:hypothetical protein n=1 Tax=Streptomyces sudanensis TaxID=436397 RepID=UPI0020CF208F|nr:hypothetical protein [Streptomyces sudanensis]MCP9957026.1 hypothetical protein [Streptomyces sudanensis]MCQ0002390.1 hypothetical protein [Streptomyces sudanensis]